jgi:hypothetical protein
MYYSWIPDQEPLLCSSIHRLDKFGNRERGAAKLIYAMALEWRNWQTQQTQNLRVLNTN